VDVRIGVTQVPKELHLEMGDDVDRDKLVAEIEAKIATADGVVWLTDRKGRRVGVPAAKLAYVEVGNPEEGHRVGFGTR
jgi:hypothetical protein